MIWLYARHMSYKTPLKLLSLALLFAVSNTVTAAGSWLCTTEKFVGFIYDEELGYKEINFDPTKYTIEKTSVTAQGTPAQEPVYGFFGMEKDDKPYSTGTGFNEQGVLIMDGWFKVIFNPKNLRFSLVDIGGFALSDRYKAIPTSLGMGRCVETD